MNKVLPFIIVTVYILLTPQLVFAGGSPVQNNSQYTTPSGTAPSDGISTETISVHLQDATQANVSGHIIALSSSNNSTATFPENNKTTDTFGNATFTVATTTPGTVKITLTDTTDSVSFVDWFSVSFYDSSKGCSSVPAAPVLSSVVSKSDTTATLAWVDSPNPVNNYLISYGLDSKNYSYGNPNIGPQGTTGYTVGALNSGKKYYFAIAANNNCGTSGFSNEVSAIINPTSPTPFVTPVATTVATQIFTPYPVPSQGQVSLEDPINSPLPTLPTLATTSKNKSILYRNLGICIIAAGILIIIAGLVIQFLKNKKTVKALGDSPPQPFSLN